MAPHTFTHANSSIMKSIFLPAVLFVLAACDSQPRTEKSATDSLPVTQKKIPVLIDSSVHFPKPGRFHQLLAASTGTWVGESLLLFSPDAAPVDGGTSLLVNTMSSDGLYLLSEVKGNIKAGNGKPWTGLRITGYDTLKKVFTRAMIGDSPSIEGVAMEGAWDEATRSFTMPFTKKDPTGKGRKLKEVYRFVDANTEILEIYDTDPKTDQEFRMLQVTWTRKE